MTTTSPIPDASTAASVVGSATPTGSTANAATGLTQNFNTFLTLLTTQLQNQDPLSPLDTNQFTQQLVSFSEVEQQINTNSNLQQLITLQGAGESIAALPLVGQNIEYSSATAPLANGKANFSYTLPSAATGATLTVTDANNAPVFQQNLGATAAGTYAFNWNGQTATGVQLPDGNYTLSIQAAGANNTTVTPTVDSIGAVSAVGVQNGAASFTVGGMSIPMSELVTVNPKLTQTN
ncbi:MAG TPA: flagellar hook capping FlgD N-terminal domain-containing protein [Stellaceae bacterium]|nr:flagellar hook capping FlgD N-terminal domain-containing protein [Stellaceae bacterium]